MEADQEVLRIQENAGVPRKRLSTSAEFLGNIRSGFDAKDKKERKKCLMDRNFPGYGNIGNKCNKWANRQ